MTPDFYKLAFTALFSSIGTLVATYFAIFARLNKRLQSIELILASVVTHDQLAEKMSTSSPWVGDRMHVVSELNRAHKNVDDLEVRVREAEVTMQSMIETIRNTGTNVQRIVARLDVIPSGAQITALYERIERLTDNLDKDS